MELKSKIKSRSIEREVLQNLNPKAVLSQAQLVRLTMSTTSSPNKNTYKIDQANKMFSTINSARLSSFE